MYLFKLEKLEKGLFLNRKFTVLLVYLFFFFCVKHVVGAYFLCQTLFCICCKGNRNFQEISRVFAEEAILFLELHQTTLKLHIVLYTSSKTDDSSTS